jgi:hypothetical protein
MTVQCGCWTGTQTAGCPADAPDANRSDAGQATISRTTIVVIATIRRPASRHAHITRWWRRGCSMSAPDSNVGGSLRVGQLTVAPRADGVVVGAAASITASVGLAATGLRSAQLSTELCSAVP